MKRTKLNRRRSRGAAMVESAVFMPIFITMWVSIGFLGTAYRTKIFTKKYAREYTWGLASNGCQTAPAKDADDKSGNGTASSTQSDAMGGENGNAADADVQAGLSDPNVNKNGGPNTSGSTASMTYQGKAKSPWNDGVNGFLSEGHDYSSKISVMCNEVPEDGNLLSEITKAFKDVFSF